MHLGEKGCELRRCQRIRAIGQLIWRELDAGARIARQLEGIDRVLGHRAEHAEPAMHRRAAVTALHAGPRRPFASEGTVDPALHIGLSQRVVPVLAERGQHMMLEGFRVGLRRSRIDTDELRRHPFLREVLDALALDRLGLRQQLDQQLVTFACSLAGIGASAELFLRSFQAGPRVRRAHDHTKEVGVEAKHSWIASLSS